MSRSRYFMELSYDGGAYHGWQVQPNALTVQEVITGALEKQLRSPDILLTGCGRTDTGVHASLFYAHFDIDQVMEGKSLDELTFKLNSQLPHDISILRIFPVEEGHHARFSAVSRTYRYFVHRRKDPFLQGYSYYYYGSLDVGKMNEGATLISGFDDFTSFSKLHTQVNHNICHIESAVWTEEDHRLIFTITADRFLRNMVRAIVGTLLDLGRGKISIDQLDKIVRAKDRGMAGESIPAHGLFLVDVRYPEGIIPLSNQ